MREEMLIECVKRYPELYDPHHPLYTVTGKKSAIWATVAREVGDTAPACKSRWNSMRDAYRKSVNRNVARIRKGERTKFYKYSQSLAFLKPFIKSNKGKDESDDEVESLEDDSESAQREIMTPKRQKVTEESEKSPSGVYLEYYPDVASEEVHESPVVEQQQGLNTIDSFLACIGATLKSLPPYYASLAKADIFACAHKYELRAITEQQAARGQASGLGGSGGVPLVSASSSEAAVIKLDPLEPQ